VDRALVSAIAHRRHPIAAPVSEESAFALITGLEPELVSDSPRILDLGCGSGEWLLTALKVLPGWDGIGIDLSEPALDEARRKAAAEHHLRDRVRFEHSDAATWTGGRFDVVICIGATHAFGGLGPTLDAVRRHLLPGGRVLLGEGYWEGAPTQAALDGLGAAPGELPDLAGLIDEVQRHGYEPGYGHLSTAAEWDRYEWSWTGSLVAWALEEADDDDRDAALAVAREHRRQWLAGYRGQLGFATLVLHDIGT